MNEERCILMKRKNFYKKTTTEYNKENDEHKNLNREKEKEIHVIKKIVLQNRKILD
jgi:hypothetical protein